MHTHIKIENMLEGFSTEMPIVFYSHESAPLYQIKTGLKANTSFLDIVHPCDYQRVQEKLKEIYQTGSSYEIAFMRSGNDGHDELVINYSTCTIDSDGNPCFSGILVNVNDLSLKQEELLLQRTMYFNDQNDKQHLVGDSLSFQNLKKDILKVANIKAFALLLGESGVGKELVARTIHENSPHAKKPFIAVNCGAIPENLMESMFFGHQKGAFSGAEKNHKGIFTEAKGGTLFLDEVGELPLSMQVKLLRVLDGSPYTPIGSSESIIPDVRIIGATNRDLNEQVRLGKMRADFLFRINVLSIKIPPLRERKEDIPLLIQHFLQDYASIKPIPGRMLEVLMHYDWPGNIRELRNALIYYATFEKFPADIIKKCALLPCTTQDNCLCPLRGAVADFERNHISNILTYTNGNRSLAADILKIDRRTLFEKIRTLGIKVSNA